MKKLVLATLVAATFSTAALANDGDLQPISDVVVDPIVVSNSEKVKAANAMFEGNNVDARIVGDVTTNGATIYSIEYTDQNTGEKTVKELNAGTDVDALKLAVRDGIQNQIVIDPIEDMPSIPVTREEAIDYANKTMLRNGDNFSTAVSYRMNNDVKVDLAEKLTTDQKLAFVNKQFATTDGKPRFDKVVSTNGEMGGVVLIDNQTGEQFTQAQVDAMVVDAKQQVVKEAQERAEGDVGINPPEAPIEEMPEVGVQPENVKTAVQKLVATGKSTNEQLSAIYKTQADTDSRQDTAIATNSAGIAENKQAITFLNSEIDRLDDKIDGVMAGVHAVNNARPYLNAEGQTAVGAGVGFAGNNSAVAVGVAHAYTERLSFSATMNVTTGDESELSGGFGTQYTF